MMFNFDLVFPALRGVFLYDSAVVVVVFSGFPSPFVLLVFQRRPQSQCGIFSISILGFFVIPLRLGYAL